MSSQHDARIEFEFMRATEAAAVASGRLVGRGNKEAVEVFAQGFHFIAARDSVDL